MRAKAERGPGAFDGEAQKKARNAELSGQLTPLKWEERKS
jgi:hypothetical protein